MYSKLTAALLAAALAAPAQQPSPLLAQSTGLKIVVVEGEGATNQIRSRSGVGPLVEVRDDSDKPVPGAEVTFQLPLAGPSAYFNGWLRQQTVKTDRNGRAGVTGYTPNEEEGRFNIKVSAATGTRTASAVIAQTNVRAAGAAGGGSTARAASNNRKWWVVAAVVGAGAIAGGVAASRNGNGTTAAAAPRAVTISPGAITVGGPR